eukprot:GHVU01151619.1.p1 GENE.GHVU01151619.1~~GHVU01151619.1.p1  ORF type:complete len:177 (-),score=13.99 GHVU01151619.1:271-801(-)
MDDPVAEIRDVVRGLTEPYEAKTIAVNVEKYFTENAVLKHPFVCVASASNSRDAIKGIYKILRVNSVNQKIEFHAVTFNEDKTQVALDLTEYMSPRYIFNTHRIALRLIVLLELIKGSDGKFRITKQEDNFPSDTPMISFPFIPGLAKVFNIVKSLAGFGTGLVGDFLLSKGWFGA